MSQLATLVKMKQNSQWRHLLAGYDAWKLNDLGNKGRFSTIRSKQQYVLGWDYLEKVRMKFLRQLACQMTLETTGV